MQIALWSRLNPDALRLAVEPQSGELLGYLAIADYRALEASPLKAGYLYSVATQKSMRGKGIMTALIKNTFEWMRKQSYHTAILIPSSQELFPFYHRLGFRQEEAPIYHRYSGNEPVLQPCGVSKLYHEKAASLSGSDAADYPILEDREGVKLLPPVGWMSYPLLMEKETLPPLVQPLT